MASSGKKKTTMAKLMRESKMRERRQDKQARKDARKRAAAEHPGESYRDLDATGEAARPGGADSALDTSRESGDGDGDGALEPERVRDAIGAEHPAAPPAA